jgi:photosystem II stability/assembly factor-like uncharacterized protein
MYVALRDGVFRTDGAGDRWARLAGGPANVAAVVVNPRRSNEVVAATTDGRIFASPDEGETWQPVK